MNHHPVWKEEIIQRRKQKKIQNLVSNIMNKSANFNKCQIILNFSEIQELNKD